MEIVELGRFRLVRQGKQVPFAAAVDARTYRDRLHVWADGRAWDWGGDKVPE